MSRPKVSPPQTLESTTPGKPPCCLYLCTKMTEHVFMYSWKKWRSLCTAGGDVGVIARWQHAMFQGLGRRGGRRGEDRRRGSHVVAGRMAWSRKTKRRKEEGGHKTKRHRWMNTGLSLTVRPNLWHASSPSSGRQRRCPWRPPAGSPPPLLAPAGARNGTAPCST